MESICLGIGNSIKVTYAPHRVAHDIAGSDACERKRSCFFLSASAQLHLIFSRVPFYVHAQRFRDGPDREIGGTIDVDGVYLLAVDIFQGELFPV